MVNKGKILALKKHESCLLFALKNYVEYFLKKAANFMVKR